MVRVGRAAFEVSAVQCHGMSSVTLDPAGPYEQKIVTAVNGFIQQANARRLRLALSRHAAAARPAVVLTLKNALFGSDPDGRHFGQTVDLQGGVEMLSGHVTALDQLRVPGGGSMLADTGSHGLLGGGMPAPKQAQLLAAREALDKARRARGPAAQESGGAPA